MALAKTNPLPNGLYSIDLSSPTSSNPKDGVAVLAAWTKANRGKVIVHKVTVRPEGRTSVLFEVVGRPGAFPFGLGYPTITTSSTTGSLDEWIQTSASQFEGLALLYIFWELTKRR